MMVNITNLGFIVGECDTINQEDIVEFPLSIFQAIGACDTVNGSFYFVVLNHSVN